MCYSVKTGDFLRMKTLILLFRSLVSVFLVHLLTQSPAYGLDFTEFGALTLSSPNISSSQDSTLQSNLGALVGGGISLGVRVFGQFDVESGILYFGQSFSTTSSVNPSTQYTLWTAEIPVLVRYWFNEKFSAGIGGYWNHGSGNITVSQGSTTLIQGYQDLSWVPDEGGVCVSLRYRSPINELMSFIVDGRGLFGVTNMNHSGSGTFQTRSVLILAGVSFIL